MAEQQQFPPGTIVDIAIKGVRVSTVTDSGLVTIYDEHDDPYPMPPQAAITCVAPADWPPQVRDLWQDGAGDLWFAFEDYDQDNDSFVNLRCSVAKSTQGWGPTIAYYVNDEHGPMTLVRREQQGGGESRG